jgi:hypothetical protein
MSQTVKIDKIASVVCRMQLPRMLEVTPHMEAASGNAVVVRVLPEGKSRQELELADGRMIRMFGGDILVGALGRRRALRGFVGEVPESIHVGDQLAVLNRGGVIGRETSPEPGSVAPLPCEVVGMPVVGGRVPNIRDFAIPETSSLSGRKIPPVVIVSGTSMQSGKTSFLAEIIQSLTKKGLNVAAGKLTGVACLRDLLSMQDNGAISTASFQDAGYPSTAGMNVETLVATSKAVIAYLAESGPELILLELGDGLVGDYGVTDVLMDREIRETIQVHAFCANDLAGAWGGQRYLAEHGFGIDLFSGPVTDNRVGIDYLEAEFNVPAINACRHPARAAEAVLNLLSLKKQMVS